MKKHKNSNDAVGDFCIYRVLMDRKVYKVGKADFDRITLTTGMPTRIHQQIRILSTKYINKRIEHEILEILFGVSTLDAKRLERKVLNKMYESDRKVPDGNSKSFTLMYYEKLTNNRILYNSAPWFWACRSIA